MARVAVFSAKSYDREYLKNYNTEGGHGLELTFFDVHLNESTAKLGIGFPVVCVFVNDQVNAAVLKTLADGGLKLLALRCAGFNNVDLEKAQELGVKVARVPAYSPYAVAEHAVGLILCLNRHLHKAYNKVRDGNFSLDGLMGFDLHERTVGIVGTGKIGAILARIMKQGFGCKVVAYDVVQNKEVQELGIAYVSLDELYAQSDIISLHVPLLPATAKMVNATSIKKMKKGVMLINTSRGPLVDSKALIEGLKSGQIGYLGLDVYEEESELFYDDLSNTVLTDDVFARLLTFPNVLITGHQAFFTSNAMTQIATTTLANIAGFLKDGKIAKENEVLPAVHKAGGGGGAGGGGDGQGKGQVKQKL